MRSKIILVTCFLQIFYFLNTAVSQSLLDPSEVDDVVLSDLNNSSEWGALLHLDDTTLYSNHSKALKSEFIEVNNPLAVLKDTINKFNNADPIDDNNYICKYPARYKWLSSKIRFNQSVNPIESCPSLNTWFDAINPEKVTVIFPASFLNNPASAFGHTFIRFDQPNQTESTRLLAYAVDYAAQTQGEDAISYAFKGIFGGYEGLYSVSPFYKKVTQYSDLENRDIWEYQLSFSKEEVSNLVLHVWELRQVPFSYYYFDENCSYHILALLDVARPKLELRKRLKNWVIPIDTIRELEAADGLIAVRTFRASAATKLKSLISNSSTEALNTVDSILSNDFSGLDKLSEAQKIEALDLAYDLSTYRRIKNSDESEESKKLSWKILLNRSKLLEPSKINIEQPPYPEGGHKSAMFSVGAGYGENHFLSILNIRPAFHSLSDPLTGYPFGSEIKFFDTTISVSNSDSVALEKITPLQITSLTGVDRFFDPVSWQVNLFAERNRNFKDSEPLIYYSDVSFGKAINFNDSLMLYLLGTASGQYGDALEKGYSIGGGATSGIVFNQSETLNTNISYKHIWYGLFGGDNALSNVNIAQRISLNRDHQLILEFNHKSQFHSSDITYLLRWQMFFTP